MKPFNLEEAKAGKPVCTRDGRSARVVDYDYNPNKGAPILAVMPRPDGTANSVHSYSATGKFTGIGDGTSGLDLFMAPVQRTVWVNLYKASEAKVGMVSGGLYASEQEAVLIAGESPSYVGTFPITYEE